MAHHSQQHWLQLAALVLALALLAGCASTQSTAQQAAQPIITAAPTATVVPTPPADTPTVAPSPTLAPTVPPATATATATAVPTPGPPRVGIQVGHWKLEELPPELVKLRKASGSYYGGYDEWELNIEIATALQQQLEAAGVQVDLLPATVPIGYQADAFISVHCDGVTGAAADVRRGWKVATPWRASPDTEALAAAIAESYPAVTGLPADTRGPSYEMRSYYTFSSFRFWHTIAPTTPAVIVETAFLTHPVDRELLFDQPDLLASGIAEGVLRYLADYDRNDAARRDSVFYPMLQPRTDGTALHTDASAAASVEIVIDSDERLVPLAEADGWYLVTTRSDWDIGWVAKADVIAVDEPQIPPHPRPQE